MIATPKGENFNITLSKEEGYGEYHDEYVLDLAREVFSINGHFDHEHIYVDAIVPLQNEEGHRFNGRVLEVGEEKVKIDLNHPLAGETLYFEGTVLENRDATKEEIDHMMKHLTGGCSGNCGDCGGGCGDDCDCGCHDHDHEHEEGHTYEVPGYSVMETHSHEGATICSFEKDILTDPEQAKVAMEDAIHELTAWLDSIGALIGHVKGYIKEHGPTTTFSTTGSTLNIEGHEPQGAAIGFASIVFGPTEEELKDKVVEVFERL